MTQHPRFPGMSALGENYEWYIGRDGQQYGPVTSAEMVKLIELGHLRPVDLVWRSGFAEWQSAALAFALTDERVEPQPPTPPVAAKPNEATPVPGAQTSGTVAPGPDDRPRAGTTAASAQSAPVRDSRSPIREAAAAATYSPPAASAVPTAASRAAAASAAPASSPAAGQIRLEDVAAAIQTASPAGIGMQPVAREPYRPDTVVPSRRAAPAPRAEVAPAPAAAPEKSEVHHRRQARKHPPHDHSRKRRRGRAAVLVTLAALVLVGVAGGAAYVWRDKVETFVTRLTAVAPESAPPGPPPAPPAANSMAAADAIAKSPLWTFIRAEFPEWHAERLREAQKLRADKKDDAVVLRYMMEQLVQLRRNHAEDALSASPAAIKSVSEQFVVNLLELNRHSVDACYSYISHGEASNALLPLYGDKTLSDMIEKQLLAVFTAIAEGRKERQQHLPPRKADYDQLARELVRRGWTDADLQVFSDPRALGRARPVVVCKLVREWFQAQLALDDPAAQVRLLAESLRPVVGG